VGVLNTERPIEEVQLFHHVYPSSGQEQSGEGKENPISRTSRRFFLFFFLRLAVSVRSRIIILNKLETDQ
jgi:hypothetical protein